MSKINYYGKILLCGLVFLIGCDSKSNDSLQKLYDDTVEASDKALDKVSSVNSEEAKKEFRKLGQFEYQVLSFKKDIPAAELEGRLGVYGLQGFDCQSPLIRNEELIVLCKRRPESFLRYIPQTIVGRP